ncbi:MAG TPA: OmpA family protein [Gammaproteobacteria bacterium]|nr:OmpA family protein [Gammaproteobacteria bacterium]
MANRSLARGAAALLGLICASLAFAQQDLRATLFVEADQALAAARAANAEQLAPATFERAMDSYKAAENDLARSRNADRVRAELATASKGLKQAKDTAEIANVTLASLIKTRADATKANAATFATQQWTAATERFDAAARKLESGDVRGARTRSDEAEALFRDAELNSIKAQYLSQTRALLAEADQGRVARVAPKTLEHARALLAQAEKALNENRYDTDLPRSLAQQANYEARHAIYLAKIINAMRDENRTLEDVIVSYEEPLVQIGAAADKVVQFDKGVDPVTADLVAYVEKLREEAAQSSADVADTRKRVGELQEEIRGLDEQLGGVSKERVALAQRLEAQARIREQFATVENMFGRDEARVSREGNKVTIRLVGLTFPSGQATVLPTHRALLEKVQKAADVFPGSQIVIEGHTDSYGDDEANLTLSRRRAEAIGAYLSGNLGVQAFRISSVGYGETQPIASNDTPQGRERNRRIDVIIEPQADR